MNCDREPIVLVIAEIDEDYMTALKAALGDFRGIIPLTISVEQLERGGIVDAVFLTLPQAEKWNAQPLIHRAQVLPTNPRDPDDENLPPFVIAGVAKSQSDPTNSPVFDLELVVRCILEAAREHNQSCDDPGRLIKTVGIWPPMIGMDQLAPGMAAATMVSTYESALHRFDDTDGSA